jgi:hypothetical protein
MRLPCPALFGIPWGSLELTAGPEQSVERDSTFPHEPLRVDEFVAVCGGLVHERIQSKWADNRPAMVHLADGVDRVLTHCDLRRRMKK